MNIPHRAPLATVLRGLGEFLNPAFTRLVYVEMAADRPATAEWNPPSERVTGR
jgi:hypothetical protein